MLPILDPIGHEPLSASGWPHNGTLESIPNRPDGVCTWIPLTYCSRSCRERFIVNVLNFAAFGVTVPATKPGLNGTGLEQPATSKNDDGVASGVPAISRFSGAGVTPGALQGVRSAVVSADPHMAESQARANLDRR